MLSPSVQVNYYDLKACIERYLTTDCTVSALWASSVYSADEQDESNCYLQLPLMPHECGTSKPCQRAQTASSERAQCVSGNGSSCRALNMT
jgi:hypothetical protein